MGFRDNLGCTTVHCVDGNPEKWNAGPSRYQLSSGGAKGFWSHQYGCSSSLMLLNRILQLWAAFCLFSLISKKLISALFGWPVRLAAEADQGTAFLTRHLWAVGAHEEVWLGRQVLWFQKLNVPFFGFVVDVNGGIRTCSCWSFLILRLNTYEKTWLSLGEFLESRSTSNRLVLISFTRIGFLKINFFSNLLNVFKFLLYFSCGTLTLNPIFVLQKIRKL